MELISRISSGSKMDQIYLPKRRYGFDVGKYVVIKPLTTEKVFAEPFFYNISYLEPIKVIVIKQIFSLLADFIDNYDNVIITGSFLDKGFNFNDVDILVVASEKINSKILEVEVSKATGVKAHLIIIDNISLVKGLSTDPLYQAMISRCVSKNRLIYNFKPKINYKLLDLHLLKSKTLIDNFDLLDGSEKYYLTRNMIAIMLFIKGDKASVEKINQEIKNLFNMGGVDAIKKNMLNKNDFLRMYKFIYNKVFNSIMKGIYNESKQK